MIGLVQGATDGAVGLAACCDIVLATANASFCLSEVKLGLVPAVISPYVVRAIGERQARRYFISASLQRATACESGWCTSSVTTKLPCTPAATSCCYNWPAMARKP